MTVGAEQVLADARGDAAVLRRHGASAVADAIEELADRFAESAHAYLTWISEMDAVLRSGKKARYWRGQFPALEQRGLARWNPANRRQRQYRLLIVPPRSNLAAVRADARRTAQREQPAP